MSKTKSAVDEFETAFLPFQRMLNAVQELKPILSKEQAVSELDKAISVKQEKLETLGASVEVLKEREKELNESSGQEAEKLLKQAKEKATGLVDSANRKASSIENDIATKLQAYEDSVLELESRAQSAKDEEKQIIQSVSEQTSKLNQIKEAISRLASQE
jgi:cell division septum initiation protein DivIVA